jgi:hypothetical protein
MFIGAAGRRPHRGVMQLISRTRPAGRLGPLVSGTLLGASLVATGFVLAFMTVGTPFVARLVPASRIGSTQGGISMIVWALALIAGAALAAAGANRLAATIASVRTRTARLSPVLRMMRTLPDEVVVATDVVPNGGRPIPELVVGPFGVAVVHEMSQSGSIRRVGESWETRTSDGWLPAETPLDGVVRDAERIRHWLAHGDLDFVVRVYAALVTSDLSIARSAGCAVLSADQIPAWIAALPRQRSFTAGRRHHLLARVREAVAPGSVRGDW